MSLLIPNFKGDMPRVSSKEIDSAPVVERLDGVAPKGEYGLVSAASDGLSAGWRRTASAVAGGAEWLYEAPQAAASNLMMNGEESLQREDALYTPKSLPRPSDETLQQQYPVEGLPELEAFGERMRKEAAKYAPPEDSTLAQKVMYGLGSEVPNLLLTAASGAMGGPFAAASTYGFLHGISTTQSLADAGVPEDAAQKAGFAAGVVSGGAVFTPAAFGTSLVVKAGTGAGINVGAALLESLGTQAILQRAGDDNSLRMARSLDMGADDYLVAAGFGAAVGTGAWAGRRLNDAKHSRLAQFDDKEVEAFKKKRDEALKARSQAKEKEEHLHVSKVAERAKEEVDEKQLEAIQKASADRRDAKGRVLQNRDRSSAASISQMNSIAANPDYYRLGYSNTLSNGAPVVAYVGREIPPGQLGREVVVADAKGGRQLMRFAVVDASAVRASNDVHGRPDPHYGTPDAPTAIAGNGRIAGLTEAYLRGTADKYRAEMMQDSATTGISPDVIARMKEPILVRIMDDENVTADIGDVSNMAENAVLSPTEMARTDAQRIDLSKLEYGADGRFTNDSVAMFVRLLPENERGRLLDKTGVANKDARDRLDRAVFMAAYGSDSLSELLTHPNSQVGNLLSVYRRLAPRMLALEEAGDLNFTDVMVDVAEEIRNASVSGNFSSLKDLANQRSMTRSPEADLFLQFWAKDGMNRKVNEPYEVFGRLVDYAVESKRNSGGLFGDEVPDVTRNDLMKRFSELTETKFDPTEFLSTEERRVFDGLSGGLKEDEAIAMAKAGGAMMRQFSRQYAAAADSVSVVPVENLRGADAASVMKSLAAWYGENLIRLAEEQKGSFYVRQDFDALFCGSGAWDMEFWKSLPASEKKVHLEKAGAVLEDFVRERTVERDGLVGPGIRFAQWMRDVVNEQPESSSFLSAEATKEFEKLLGKGGVDDGVAVTQTLEDAARLSATERVLGDNLTTSEHAHIRDEIKLAQMKAANLIDEGGVLDSPVGRVDVEHLLFEVENMSRNFKEATAEIEAELEKTRVTRAVESPPELEAPRLFEVDPDKVTPTEARALEALERNPGLLDEVLRFEDENGQVRDVSVREMLEETINETTDEQTFAQALKETAVECVLRNGGM